VLTVVDHQQQSARKITNDGVVSSALGFDL